MDQNLAWMTELDSKQGQKQFYSLSYAWRVYGFVEELTVRKPGVSHVPLTYHFKEERMLTRVI